MKTYRCKHIVEAKRWMDVPEGRAPFAAWFEKHGVTFSTRGSEVILPDDSQGDGAIIVGEWILFSHGKFIAMDDEEFTNSYEEY
jgi:hypothetical protein